MRKNCITRPIAKLWAVDRTKAERGLKFQVQNKCLYFAVSSDYKTFTVLPVMSIVS